MTLILCAVLVLWYEQRQLDELAYWTRISPCTQMISIGAIESARLDRTCYCVPQAQIVRYGGKQADNYLIRERSGFMKQWADSTTNTVARRIQSLQTAHFVLEQRFASTFSRKKKLSCEKAFSRVRSNYSLSVFSHICCGATVSCVYAASPQGKLRCRSTQ